jgi:hypothetical protein
MPSNHRFRGDHHQRLFPFGPERSCQDPEELIEYYEPWPGMPSFQCRELLAKSEVFEKQPATTVKESEDRTNQENTRVNQMRVLSRFARE